MEILSKSETEKLICIKDQFLSVCNQKLPMIDQEKQKQLQERVSCIKTAIDSFGSATFIVSCVGMLKSGKSTLVNLFSRNGLASPTGYGFDTTLRPALVMDCDEKDGKIEIWLRNNSSKPLSKSVFDKLFTHLRGIESTENIAEVSCHAYPLNQANLLNSLCKKAREAENNMLPSEPVLVVVKVPRREGSLLSSEILILDTPGLDSGISEWTKETSERFLWIVSNSDLLLFLQSSVAPLNIRAAQILKDIREHDPSTPVWLIQNEMITKPWLPTERTRETTQKQRDLASEMFHRVAQKFDQVNANLGKADSAIFDLSLPEEERKELLCESQFESMEKNICDSLRVNIGPIRRGNCKSNVLREISQAMADIKRFGCSACIEKAKNDIKELEKINDDVKSILLDPPFGEKFSAVGEHDDIVLSASNPFKVDELIKFLERVAEQSLSKDKYGCDDLKKIFEKIKEDLIERLRDTLRMVKLYHFALRLQNSDQKNNIAKYVKEKFAEFVSSLIIKNKMLVPEMKNLIAECCAAVELPIFPEEVNVDVKDLDHITIDVQKKESSWNVIWELDKRTKKQAKNLFQLDYLDKTKGLFVKLILSCEETMKQNLVSWLNEFVYEICRDDFIRRIDARIDHMVTEKRAELTRLEEENQALTDMLSSCNQLEACIKDF